MIPKTIQPIAVFIVIACLATGAGLIANFIFKLLDEFVEWLKKKIWGDG